MKRVDTLTFRDIRMHSSIAAVCANGTGDIVWEAKKRLAPLCMPECEGKSVAEQLCVAVSDLTESGLQPLLEKLRELDPLFHTNWSAQPMPHAI